MQAGTLFGGATQNVNGTNTTTGIGGTGSGGIGSGLSGGTTSSGGTGTSGPVSPTPQQ